MESNTLSFGNPIPTWVDFELPKEKLCGFRQYEDIVYGYVDGNAVCYSLSPDTRLEVLGDLWPWTLVEQMVWILDQDGTNEPYPGIRVAQVMVDYQFMRKEVPPWSHVIHDGSFYIHVGGGIFMVVRFAKHRNY